MSYDKNGVCIFAYNNDQIDYVKIATLCGKLAKKHLNLPVALLTDEGSASWLNDSLGQKTVNSAFDYILITDVEHKSNKRVHKDSPWYEYVAEFKNSNKHEVINYTPFENTLLIDSDYLIMNNRLLDIFNKDINIGMFENALTIRNNFPPLREVFLNDTGIKMWWSTVIYFTKNVYTQMFFDIWSHVKDNYDYYQFLYKFPTGLYRTDFAVSIATHILNGRIKGDFISKLPQNQMYYSMQ